MFGLDIVIGGIVWYAFAGACTVTAGATVAGAQIVTDCLADRLKSPEEKAKERAESDAWITKRIARKVFRGVQFDELSKIEQDFYRDNQKAVKQAVWDFRMELKRW